MCVVIAVSIMKHATTTLEDCNGGAISIHASYTDYLRCHGNQTFFHEGIP